MAMEIGPCRLIPKRRRLAPASRSAGVRRYVGVDRLSDLPDGILGDIVSLLPIDDGARTQILASRWRHIWRCSAPLNLDCDVLDTCRRGRRDDDEVAGLISHILSSHRGTGRRLCGSFPLSDRTATIDALLQSAALDNLQELDLWYSHDHLHLPLPRCVVSRFSTTLRVATIAQCNLPDSTVQGLQFPHLKQLELLHVLISEYSLNHMIASCPSLDCLMIERSFGFRCVRINSLSLKSICVHFKRPLYLEPSELHLGELQFGELIIDNAPCLKRLIHLDLDVVLHISVISAPKLETLSCRSRGNFDSTVVIQGLHIDSLTTVVRTVQTLAIDMPLNLDIIINFMRCFPCLERLYIKPCGSGKNAWRRKHRNVTRSLDINLKTIVLASYSGGQPYINFVTFFVLNVRVLELMTFQVDFKHYNEEFLAQQQRKLQVDKRASRAAEFHFTTDRCLRSIEHNNHVHDLDVTDPFIFADAQL